MALEQSTSRAAARGSGFRNGLKITLPRGFSSRAKRSLPTSATTQNRSARLPSQLGSPATADWSPPQANAATFRPRSNRRCSRLLRIKPRRPSKCVPDRGAEKGRGRPSRNQGGLEVKVVERTAELHVANDELAASR